MTISKYDSDFSDVMALKLRLNREAKELTEFDKFRLEIAQETVVRHPKVNVETVLQMMKEMGF